MSNDTVDHSALRKDKKKSKRKHDDVRAADDAVDQPSKPSKKHRHSQPDDNSSSKKSSKRDETDADRKERKKRKREQRKAAEQAAPRPLDEAATSPSLSYKENAQLAVLPASQIEDFLKSKTVSIANPNPPDLRPIISFDHLPDTSLLPASMAQSFKAPTPIQSAAWPYAFAGRDIVGVAETGSGKTLAFGLPCARMLASLPREKGRKPKVRALVVSPTRELALQINEQFGKLSAAGGLQTACVYGGVPKDEQRKSIAGANVLIATPGRLNDFVGDGTIDLSGVQYAVLDEADRMLDKGFEEDIKTILSQVPNPRQVLMFTATWPESIRKLASTFMTSPVKITIGGDGTGELRASANIAQTVEVIEPRQKQSRLLSLLQTHTKGSKKNDRILVFCLYKKEAARIEDLIRSKGYKVAGIHGDMAQSGRERSLEAFKSGKTPILVATDVAARGIDIPSVSLVLNNTFPLTAEDYVHRIGRTGRAGQKGMSITLFTEQEKGLSGALINVLRATQQEVPEALLSFGATVKTKQHDVYGAFYKDPSTMAAPTKITFD